MNPNLEKLKSIVLQHIGKWSLYEKSHRVDCGLCNKKEDHIWIAYRSKSGIPIGTTHWDVNIIKGVFYILHITIVKDDRGQGHGDAFYKIMVDIAHDFGCTEIRQTPSGKTTTGETRKSYLERRGWLSDGDEVFQKCCQH